jgi:hypothetical protein
VQCSLTSGLLPPGVFPSKFRHTRLSHAAFINPPPNTWLISEMKFPARAYSFVRFLPVCLFYFTAANADVLVLKNGDRITGEISRIWDSEVTIEPEYSDEFGLPACLKST